MSRHIPHDVHCDFVPVCVYCSIVMMIEEKKICKFVPKKDPFIYALTHFSFCPRTNMFLSLQKSHYKVANFDKFFDFVTLYHKELGNI